MSIHETTLTGAAGEHYVMFCLLSRGYIAGLAPQGAPNTDIIATDVGGKKSVAIQVKTRLPKGTDNGWHMRPKHAELAEPNLFYCLVDSTANPTVFIVPSKIVAEVIDGVHKLWLSIPGKNGRAHKDSNVRRLLPDYSKTLKIDHELIKKYSLGWLDKYRNNWKILGLD